MVNILNLFIGPHEPHFGLDKYPEFKMNVYQTRRTACLPQEAYDVIKSMSTKIELQGFGINAQRVVFVGAKGQLRLGAARSDGQVAGDDELVPAPGRRASNAPRPSNSTTRASSTPSRSSSASRFSQPLVSITLKLPLVISSTARPNRRWKW